MQVLKVFQKLSHFLLSPLKSGRILSRLVLLTGFWIIPWITLLSWMFSLQTKSFFSVLQKSNLVVEQLICFLKISTSSVFIIQRNMNILDFYGFCWRLFERYMSSSLTAVSFKVSRNLRPCVVNCVAGKWLSGFAFRPQAKQNSKV